MKVFVLFAQRIESYEGQYAPEALQAATEFQLEENEDLLSEMASAYECQVGKEFVAIKWVCFDANAAEIRKHLTANIPKITAKMVP